MFKLIKWGFLIGILLGLGYAGKVCGQLSPVTPGQQGGGTVTNALIRTQNLSDLSNVAAARTNLGLGSISITGSDGILGGGNLLVSQILTLDWLTLQATNNAQYVRKDSAFLPGSSWGVSNLNVIQTLTADTLIVREITNTFLNVTNLILNGTGNGNGWTFTNLGAASDSASPVILSQLNATNAALPYYLRVDGTTPLTGGWNVGNQSITNANQVIGNGLVQGSNLKVQSGAFSAHLTTAGYAVNGPSTYNFQNISGTLGFMSATATNLIVSTNGLYMPRCSDTFAIGTNLTGAVAGNAKLVVRGCADVLTNYPLVSIQGSHVREANFLEVLGNNGTTTNFYVDKNGNVNLGPFSYTSTQLVFGATTVIGQVVTNLVLVPNAVQDGLIVVGWPSNLPTDSAWNARFVSPGTAMVTRTCIVVGSAYTNTFKITGL